MVPEIGKADRALAAYIRQIDRIITMSGPQGRQTAQALLDILQSADQSLRSRLRDWVRRHGGPELRFTEVSLTAFQAMSADVVAYVTASLAGLTSESAMVAASTSAIKTAQLFNTLERSFSGIRMAAPRMGEATVARLQPSLLARHATSVDRYGMAMIERIQRELAQGFVEGLTSGQMVDRLVALRGPTGMVSLRAVEIQPGVVIRLAEENIPEGLFMRHRNWAWRIVRTEVAEAQNAVAAAEITEASKDYPDMHKKILAVMDNRTAYDSIYVHGQVRAPKDNFVDGAGREYLRPPARPNDRETIVPWRSRWPDTPRSRPLDGAERTAMWDRNERWQAEHYGRRAKRRKETAHG